MIAITACAKGQERTDTTPAKLISSSNTPAVVAASPRVIQTTLPGALPKPLDSLSGDELFNFSRKLAYGGGIEKERHCKGSPECKSGRPMRTKLRVDAVDGQDSISVNGVPDNGVIAIRAFNRGDYPDEMYGMEPGKNFEYFLVVMPGTSLEGRWRLEQLVTTKGARTHHQVSAGSYKPCMHAFVKKKVNRANFFTCTDAHMANDSVATAGLALQDINPPMWMDCAQGCCLATQP